MIKLETKNKLNIKLHLMQLNCIKYSFLKSRYNVVLINCLKHMSTSERKKINKNTITKLLTSIFFLKENKKLLTKIIKKNNVYAVTTADHNTKASQASSLPLIINTSYILFKLAKKKPIINTMINAVKISCIKDKVDTVKISKVINLTIYERENLNNAMYNPPKSFYKVFIKKA